jgi:hypothetical protein
MPILEDMKEYAERATGLKRPGKREALKHTRGRKPHAVRFKDDGLVPKSSAMATDHLSGSDRS